MLIEGSYFIFILKRSDQSVLPLLIAEIKLQTIAPFDYFIIILLNKLITYRDISSVILIALICWIVLLMLIVTIAYKLWLKLSPLWLILRSKVWSLILSLNVCLSWTIDDISRLSKRSWLLSPFTILLT